MAKVYLEAHEVEARTFEMKWWPEFERLLKKKLEAAGIG